MSKSAIPLRKHTLNLFEGDMDWLQQYYETPASEIIRKIVRRYILELKQKAAERQDRNLERDLSP